MKVSGPAYDVSRARKMDRHVSDDRVVSADNVQRPNILVPVYAAAIHKSQGSEYPAVAIPIMTQHYVMRPRRLGYYFLFQ